MSEIINNFDIVKPARVTYKPTGAEYVLDFSRESAVFAQERGFDTDDIGVKPTIAIPNLFFFSLRKNHRNIAKNQADKLFETLFPDGMPAGLVERLVLLFQQASLINIIAEDEGKNAQTVVELD